MVTPLPNVETACSVLEQEEAQRSILSHASSQDLMAMFSKNQTDKPVVCTVCGKKGHPLDRCWNVIGYPKWHTPPNNHPRPNFTSKPRFQSNSNPKWNAPAKQHFPTQKMAAFAIQPTVPASTNSSGLLFTPQQLEQLAKLVPQFQSSRVHDSETDEEIDYHFSGMLSLSHAKGQSCEWIVDSGASNHMTPHLSAMLHSCVSYS